MIHQRSLNKGFTLVEIMFASALGVLVLAGLAVFMRTIATMEYATYHKQTINENMWTVTLKMIGERRQADRFVLYKSWEDRTVVDMQLNDQSGDFLLFVTYGDPQPYPNKQGAPIEKLVGYYRYSPTGATTGTTADLVPVRKFEIDVPVGSGYNDLADLIPAIGNYSNHEVVLELARGLADGKMFFNVLNRCIMINSQIVHGNKYKYITDTYNLTI